MKPSIIKVGKALTKVGLMVLALEFGADIGKAIMFKAVKDINPEAANDVMDAMDICLSRGYVRGLEKCRYKIIRGMCKAVIKE